MFERTRKKVLALAVSALTVASVGFVTPAFAADEPIYDINDAMLNKVVLGPEDTDTSADTYVFHFAGGGEVVEGDASIGQERDAIYADGVKQDVTTLKLGDTVPTIGDVQLNGFALNSTNTLTNGQVAQGVAQKSIADILSGVEFPHAGVYTYVVTESQVSLGTTNMTEGYYVNASQAEYILRIRVSNTYTGTNSEFGSTALTIEGVTVEQTKDDNGEPIEGDKIDPQYPTTTGEERHKIDQTAAGETPESNQLAGDGRGRNVPGFTFANEYIKGGAFVVKKLYDGDHSDRTKYSTVELVVYSEAATNQDAQGACLTYVIEGEGIDKTDNKDEFGEHRKLNGIESDIEQNNHYMAVFDSDGYARVKADLKEDSVIRITGEFGPYNPEYASENPEGNKRMILSTSGLLAGQDYYVIERDPGNYEPTGYVYIGTDNTVDPRKDPNGMETKQKLTTAATDPADSTQINAGALLMHYVASGSQTTAFVVNKIDETKVSPTGILINNLPYILMIGIPVGVFALLFVSKRRRNTAV